MSAGPIALVGSGEFTPAMRATDDALLDHVEAAGFERAVAVVPTASAPEGDASVRRWFDLAHDHYDALGAEVLEVDVRDRHDATELGHVADVQEAGLVYLSGGKPEHLTSTLRDTPLLDAILEQWRLGAALAGCSAGAMTLAAAWPPFLPFSRHWGTGIGVLPDVALIPHFDMARRMTLGMIGRLGRRVPGGQRLIGVDENTALVHDPDVGRWRVEGAGGAWALDRDGIHELDLASLPTPR